MRKKTWNLEIINYNYFFSHFLKNIVIPWIINTVFSMHAKYLKNFIGMFVLLFYMFLEQNARGITVIIITL